VEATRPEAGFHLTPSGGRIWVLGFADFSLEFGVWRFGF
jgi:hypothetical protein